MSAANPALNSLTGLRWWAAFAVFFFHMSVFAPLPIYPLFEYGHYGVMFFFVLSGFVLSWSWKLELPIRSFYIRRVGRIWPSAMIALFLAIPVFYSFTPDAAQWWVKPFDIGVLLLSVPLIQGWWLAPAVLFSGNPAAWTLTCEFFFYALHPMFQRIFIKIGVRVLIAGMAGLFVALVAFKAACGNNESIVCAPLPLPVERLPEFLMGMGIGVLARRRFFPKFQYWIPLSLLGLFVVLVTQGGQLGLGVEVVEFLKTFTNEIVLLLIVLTIASVSKYDFSGRKTGLKSRFFVKLGELSFAFYLVHATVMYLFVEIFGQLDVSWQNVPWYPLVLGIALLLALALHSWIEKPFESLFRSLSDRLSR